VISRVGNGISVAVRRPLVSAISRANDSSCALTRPVKVPSAAVASGAPLIFTVGWKRSAVPLGASSSFGTLLSTSTRRFCARPSSVAFVAIGRSAP
jgi:hypothetical protein